jgi:hypothetical protein
MRIILVAAAVTAGLLAACSKPSEPSNAPVNSEQNREAATPAAAAPGDNSFTEDQARGHLENGGYTNVGALTQDAEGKWMGTATKDGQTMSVSVDYQGTITPSGPAAGDAAAAPSQ